MTHAATPAKTTDKSKLRLFFTGLTMGIADLVPGVSGGTIALLLGIYDELLYTVKIMTGAVPRLVLKGKIKEALELTPFRFLLPLATGIIGAIFGLVYIVDYLLESHPIFVWALFFGLVLGSSYVVARRVTRWTSQRILLLIAGFTITFLVMGLPSMTGTSAPIAMFGTGAIAITAMILPGISGSLIMVLLGQYETVINAVAARDVFTLVFFATGAIVGLALFARLLTWLLKHYHMAVIAFLVGVMIGSLRRIWPWQTTQGGDTAINTLPSFELTAMVALLLMATGFIIVIILERVGVAQDHDGIHTEGFIEEVTEAKK